MPIANIKKRKIITELQEWVMLGIRAGMIQGAKNYIAQKAINLAKAILEIKRAIDMPHRARSRIDEAIRIYGLPRITECVNFFGDVTVAELNTELTTLQTYASGLYNRRINNSESWDSLAADIIANVSNEVTEWVFPLPSNYKDIWGE